MAKLTLQGNANCSAPKSVKGVTKVFYKIFCNNWILGIRDKIKEWFIHKSDQILEVKIVQFWDWDWCASFQCVSCMWIYIYIIGHWTLLVIGWQDLARTFSSEKQRWNATLASFKIMTSYSLEPGFTKHNVFLIQKIPSN